MLRGPLRRAINQIRYLEPVPPGHADPLTAAVYRQLESDFGMLAPPVALHAPVPQLLAACWLLLRESLVADAPVSRATLEAVAAAVSAGNACPYCVTVHGATRRALNAEGSSDTAEASDWARLAALRSTAAPPPAETAAGAARLIGVLMTFSYLNRMVNVFLDPSPLPGALPDLMHRPAVHLLGRFAGATAGRRHRPGESLHLLPATTAGTTRPAWAASDPVLGEAVARAGAAIDLVTAEHVPASVRRLLLELLGRWDGRPPGLDSGWLEELLADLPTRDRPAGRLALLTAFASHRITERQVDDFRLAHPGDAALLSLVSWASLTTARQLTNWIPIGFQDHRGNA